MVIFWHIAFCFLFSVYLPGKQFVQFPATAAAASGGGPTWLLDVGQTAAAAALRRAPHLAAASFLRGPKLAAVRATGSHMDRICLRVLEKCAT